MSKEDIQKQGIPGLSNKIRKTFDSLESIWQELRDLIKLLPHHEDLLEQHEKVIEQMVEIEDESLGLLHAWSDCNRSFYVFYNAPADEVCISRDKTTGEVVLGPLPASESLVNTKKKEQS